MRVDPARLDAIAEDLTEVLASGDPSQLAAALGKLAREHGMRKVAAAAGLSREALYKALRPHAQPRFATIHRVCGALGVKLVVKRAG
jgi:probable addiction module antidote protein